MTKAPKDFKIFLSEILLENRNEPLWYLGKRCSTKKRSVGTHTRKLAIFSKNNVGMRKKKGGNATKN